MPITDRATRPSTPRGYTLDMVPVTSDLTLEERHIEAVLLVDGAVTITLPGTIREGFHCTIEQSGADAVTFQAGDRATLVSFGGSTQSGGQYTHCAVYVRGKNTPLDAQWILTGTLA